MHVEKGAIIINNKESHLIKKKPKLNPTLTANANWGFPVRHHDHDVFHSLPQTHVLDTLVVLVGVNNFWWHQRLVLLQSF